MSPPKPSDSFKYKTLTVLSESEPPDYASLKLLQQQINANAMAVHSSQGDENNITLPKHIVPSSKQISMPKHTVPRNPCQMKQHQNAHSH
jgi:hypothetical protein